MFYNSKKLIDEKVLQQYFLEIFMLADAPKRKTLLPSKYRLGYCKSNEIKGLQPEVNLGKVGENIHITDFVLYPMDSTKLSKINIEIKWTKKDFENQSWRFPYYDGTASEGFVVCMKEDGSINEEYIVDKNTQKPTKIPVVYLDIEKFKNWFTIYAYNIVS